MTGTHIAMTGATGFVGGAALELALARGWTVSALTRRRQSDMPGVRWVEGALDDPASLKALVQGADAVIHIAGVVNAPDRAGFEAGNAIGTMNLIDAMRASPARRLVHVSSLAAREPDLSDYGWSKLMAERHVMASGLDWSIVRPPAIYGPGDREMLELFRMAARGAVLLPPEGRLSVIEVSDLARLLLDLAPDRMLSLTEIYEIDDGTPGGLRHREFGEQLGRAVGRKPLLLSMPAWAVNAAARIDRMLRGPKAKLTPDRARYFCHPDWVSDPARQVPETLWQPRIPTAEGLAATAIAYRAKGWI